jgi:ribonuclease HI
MADADTVLKTRSVVGKDSGQTTNNRMEMTAVLKALEFLKPDEPMPIVVYSDSRLISQGMNEWLPAWLARGWRTSGKKPVRNVDLWQQIVAAAEGKRIEWRWVEGHAGNPFNEEVDRLARRQLVEQVRREADNLPA